MLFFLYIKIYILFLLQCFANILWFTLTRYPQSWIYLCNLHLFMCVCWYVGVAVGVGGSMSVCVGVGGKLALSFNNHY